MARSGAPDRGLRQRDPRWGVRDVDELAAAAGVHSFALEEVVEMPANNRGTPRKTSGRGRSCNADVGTFDASHVSASKAPYDRLGLP